MDISNRIHEVLVSNAREEWAVEGEFQVSLSLAAIYKMDIYIYGAGIDIWSAVGFLKHEVGDQLKGIIDIDEKKDGTIVNNINVISCKRFLETIKNPSNIFVFIWINRANLRSASITNMLHDLGIRQYYIIKQQERYILTGAQHEIAWVEAERPNYYLKHEKEIVDFAKMLNDEKSVDTLVEYIRSYVEGGYYRAENIATKYKYFCDADGVELYRHLDNEVWVNCGANFGDNIFLFCRNGYHCKKIYAVEADKRIATVLKENLNLLPQEVCNKICVINDFVKESSEWNYIDCHDKITFINADIEGAELDLLKSLKNRILSDRPVLALCLYHLKEDIVDIPQFLKQNLQDYVYVLRKYASYLGCFKGTYELVLYAIPIERTINNTIK